MIQQSYPNTDDSVATWIDWMEQWHPVGIDLGLDRVRQAYLHTHFYPQRDQIPAIVIGGTNGKGSVTAYLSSILQAAGWRTGVYRSPHICRYNERFLVDDQMVEDTALTTAFAQVIAAAQQANVTLSSFEIMTLAALELFAANAVDIAVIEVGLGGRLDAVNILEPIASVITNIGLDHVEWLGNDRDIIGWEKAHIFRHDRPAIIGDREIPETVHQVAREQQTVLYAIDQDFVYEQATGDDPADETSAYVFSLHKRAAAAKTESPIKWSMLPAPGIPGRYQQDNAACALAVIATLPEAMAQHVTLEAVCEGLTAASLPGRLQVLPVAGRRWLLDVGHNADAAHALADHLQQRMIASGNLAIPAIFGVMADKDISAIVQAMNGVISEWHVVDLPLARAASAQALARQIEELDNGATIYSHSSVSEAIDAIEQRLPTISTSQAGASDIDALIFGSFHTVGEAMPVLLSRCESQTA